MRMRNALVLGLCALFALGATAQSQKPDPHSMVMSKKASSGAAKKAKPKPKGEPFAKVIKDKVAIEGLFTFYHDTTDNSVLMAIKPDQFDVVYLCGESRVAAEGAFFDNGSMGGEYPIYFKKVNDKVRVMEKNLRLRADEGTPMARAVPHAISDALLATLDVKSAPHDSTGAIIVDPTSFFLQDPANTGFFFNRPGGPGIRFDKKNSSFSSVKSFPQNSEIQVHLHYSTNRPQSAPMMQNPYSFFHTFHYSITALPESDYVPRYADDRVGYFTTIYQDYTDIDTKTPYVRYINRWHLKKKDPSAAVSEPVEPIVFWIDNKVPEEYRQAFKEGIEFWNPAFEKAGFKNAIVAKQMPDTAEWDPADVRYSVVQWMVQPGAGYAVGPSRANPFTGQILDADVRVSADFIRFMYNYVYTHIGPVTARDDSETGFDTENWFYDVDAESPFAGMDAQEYAMASQLPISLQLNDQRQMCLRGIGAVLNAAFAYEYLNLVSSEYDKDSVTQQFVHQYTVELVAHEVGHTLGFRHNFKASSIYSMEQLDDPAFTAQNGNGGTVMDYHGPWIPEPGEPIANFYSVTPGPYDNWVVEYGYTETGAATPDDEIDQLQAIAGKSGDPRLVYASDEDVRGWSTTSIDPLVNMHEQSADPLGYAERRIRLSDHLWNEAIKQVEEKGERYVRVRNAFQSGWRGYIEGARIASKYVGGIYKSRDHIGTEGGDIPFTVVDASSQKRAMNFLNQKIFAADAFSWSADLINKLQPDQMWDFVGSPYMMPTIDYPIHQMVGSVQNQALARLYSPNVLGRLLNNTRLVADGEERYTMYDMFRDARSGIWSEFANTQSVNSFRRQLQLSHLDRLIAIYLSPTGQFPLDARSLAANDLNQIERNARRLSSANVDGMTRAHAGEVVRRIEAAQSAEKSYN